MNFLKILLLTLIASNFDVSYSLDVAKIGKVDNESKFYNDKKPLEAISAIKKSNKKNCIDDIDNVYIGAKVNGSQEFYVIATVNSDIITNVDIVNMARFIAFSSGKVFNNSDLKLMADGILAKAIDIKLQEQVSKKNNMEISKKQLEKRIQDIADRNGISVEELGKKFEHLGINMDIFKKDLFSRMLFFSIVETMKNSIRITKREVEEIKKQEKENLNYTRYHVYEIYFRVSNKKSKEKVRQNAEAVYELLQNGFNFQVMAEAISQGNYRFQTGDLGPIVEKNLDKTIKSAVLSLKPGEFSGIIDTNTGFKIVYLEDKAEPHKKGSTEAKYKYLKCSIQHQGGIMTSSDSEAVYATIEKLKTAKNADSFKAICKKDNVTVEEKDEMPETPFVANILKSSMGKANTAHSMNGENYVDVYFTVSKEIPNAEIPDENELKNMLISKKAAKDFARNFKKAQYISFIKIDQKKLEHLVK
ncbi:MAG: peptidylprolyl isomerase [Holosporales bacterium]|jgi:parvulin-like peptidyl-prolyl isomerase|nr:peptidylprolyl isomerase [Holosporales bacterium]